MSGTSNVGNSQVYEAGDQRNPAQADVEGRDRYQEGKENSHNALDSKDERSIANKLGRESKRDNDDDQDISQESKESKIDATLPAKNHGNEPSKGAKIDQELKEEEEAILRKKGEFGPNGGKK